MERHDTIVIGGGQAGLAMTHHLRERGREHLLIERDRLGGKWHSERWDSLHYQFPNWSLRLPGEGYSGHDPEGFPHYSAVAEFLEEYARKLAPPARLGVTVDRVERQDDGFVLHTSEGPIAAKHVVIATGAFQSPGIPGFARKLSPMLVQLHSSAYRSPGQLPAGAVLVVGSGSSGGQIAEELHRSGRDVLLSVSRHRRVPRRFAGKDMLWWLYELGWIDRTIETFPPGKLPPAILLTGIDGGHDMDVRRFAAEGMTLVGSAIDGEGMTLCVADNVSALLGDADAACDHFVEAVTERAQGLGIPFDDEPAPRPEPPSSGSRIDLAAHGVRSIVWCTGYRPAFEWIDVPVLDEAGAPVQHRGEAACPGLYFLGLHWMHTFKSGALFGVGEDAAHIADLISGQAQAGETARSAPRDRRRRARARTRAARRGGSRPCSPVK
jgi:putative flavoprotein involved in K+ transport